MADRSNLVLLVDDDAAVRDALSFALALEGLAVQACHSGAQLLDHPDLARACCIVLDYQMPQMDGLEVVAQLAARSCGIPVILIAGRTTPVMRRRAVAAGVRWVLEKPLHDGALFDSIQQIRSEAGRDRI